MFENLTNYELYFKKLSIENSLFYLSKIKINKKYKQLKRAVTITDENVFYIKTHSNYSARKNYNILKFYLIKKNENEIKKRFLFKVDLDREFNSQEVGKLQSELAFLKNEYNKILDYIVTEANRRGFNNINELVPCPFKSLRDYNNYYFDYIL